MWIYLFVHTLTIERAKVKEYIEYHRELHCLFTVYVLYFLKKSFKLQAKSMFWAIAESQSVN